MKEFFVGQFRVDMGRSQIVDRDAIVSMEPKVLQVLLLLAEKQGEVVTHQQLLDNVWKDISVAPNTLQRCITQLRKALGDSAKLQQVIKTHPKVGYSLLVNVNFPNVSIATELGQSSPIQQVKEDKITSNTLKRSAISNFFVYLIFAVLIFLASNFLWKSESKRSSTLPITKLTALTSTDKKEYSPTFSPDGRYIAFQRYIGLCENELWAKDLQNSKEYLLTKSSGIYGTPSWSPDGQQLAFSNVTHCSLSSEFQGCKDIRTLNFALAKSEPQEPRVAMACDKKDFSAAVWITNQQIAFFEKSAGHQQRVLSLDLSNQAIGTLYSSARMLFDSLSYSLVQKRLAVTQHDAKLQASLALIEPLSKRIEQVELKPPVGYRSIVNWHTNWHPHKAMLITAKGNSFFQIDLTGQFTQHSVPTMQTIADPIFHPNGESLVASMGIFDKDIQSVNWDENLELTSGYQSETLHRSILRERDAKFSPQGKQFAFISDRSGSPQIWQSNYTEEPHQLTQLKNNQQIYSFVWSFDGNLLVALIDSQLKLINLDGQTTNIETNFKVLDIYQAPAENQVLLEIIEDDQEKVIALDLKSMQRKDYYQGEVHWAQLSTSGDIYVSTTTDSVFLWKNGHANNLVGTEDLNLAAKFIYKDNILLLTARDNSIFRYDLNDSSLNPMFRIKQVLKHVDDVDFKAQRLLMTTVASTRKEIVLFHQ